jgi:hypothetical protein
MSHILRWKLANPLASLLCGFLSILVCPLVPAAEYYVDFVGGSDAAAGTSVSTPWKTIPGTRNTGNTAYVSASYGGGTIGPSAKVAAGTVFKLKSGTTHDSSNGGRVRIDPAYYATTATLANPITFQRDMTWGSGVVTFDGTGIAMDGSGNALIEILDLGGIAFDGVTTNGIVIRNSERTGLFQYLDTITYAEGCSLQFCQFYGNGTDYPTDGAGGSGAGQFYAGGGSGVIRTIGGLRLTSCEFDGAGLFFNGVALGQSDQRVTNAIVANCTAHSHRGSDPTDVGIGFKAQNSQITYTNCVSFGNDKGFDNGEEGAFDSWEITYKLIACTVSSNSTLGMGFSGSQRGSQTTKIHWYVMNCLVYDNTNGPGIKAYSSPYNLFITGCTLQNNTPNVMAHHDGITETNSLIRVHIWNSALYQPRYIDNYSFGNFDLGYWTDRMTTYALDMDYNSYAQNNTENFSVWGSYGSGSDYHNFTHGANGPGHTNGNWYAFKGWHNDANSKGTGCAVTNLPPFRNAATRDYRLTASYPGANLATNVWYIPEMGFDFAGKPRTTWDIGAFESGIGAVEFSVPVLGATYYVDFGAGRDAAAGTNTATAWKTIPGTRNTGNTAYVSASYGGGTISTASKVTAGTVFKLKSGTTHDSSNGGQVRINPTYYATTATLANSITFQRDTTWGSGAVTFDGTGIGMDSSGNALIEITDLGGVAFDGVTTNGIVIRDSERTGLWQYLDTITYAEGCSLQFCQFYSNGTDYPADGVGGSGAGQFYAGGGSGVNRTIGGLRLTSCEFDGAGLFFNGVALGQSDQRVTNAIVANCTAHSHRGSDPTDVGIGFKGQNLQITYTNCVSFGNDKGFDNGEEDAFDSWEISYKLVACTVSSNRTLGAGFSGSARGTQTTNVNWYMMNCLVHDNTNGPGIKAYSSPYNLFITGCTLQNNAPNVMAHHDGINETNNLIRVHIWNTALYQPRYIDNYSFGNFDLGYWTDNMTTYALDMDYNSYAQKSTENFSVWGSYGGGSDNHMFTYGANGPGHTSGTWFALKGWHNDANSKGTGCTVTNLPPFQSAARRDYRLTASYPGANLATNAWYIPEMGSDRAGKPRTTWDIGAYESPGQARPEPVRGVRVVPQAVVFKGNP